MAGGSGQRWSAMLMVVMASSAVLFTSACPPYSSIFSFGDSIADTGNLYFSSYEPSNHCFFPPYGQTYFHRPSARCSDGRLIIDFVAESLGIPLVKSYLGMKNGGFENWSLKEGANFAVIGATALDISFFEERGIHNVQTNSSLKVQLNWFKELLSAHLSSSNSSTSCKEVIGNSLFLVGEIGGNDFNYPLFIGKSIEELNTYVPHVINAITSAINELIDLGARTLTVPGNFPLGCNAIYLTKYETIDINQYDSAGCLKWLNEFAEFYNQNLQSEINRLRELHPHANIIYADYYNAALPLYHYPTKYGFTGLKTCCGIGGPYNCNASTPCGNPGVIACDDPSQYISWDGIHLTEAAYRFIADGLINGPHSLPHFSTLCFKNELIAEGAVELLVPGNFPIGCSALYLTLFRSMNKEDYDTDGCLKVLNGFSMSHNKQLNVALETLRQKNPHARIMYADYFGAAKRLYHAPRHYGFTSETLRACCGGGGPFNFNISARCGHTGSKVFGNPSTYINWDGVHLTEAAYRHIAKGLINGPFTNPPIKPSLFKIS